MKKLSKDLKITLTGLTGQNAGEFLSIRVKIKTLDNEAISSKQTSTVDTQLIQIKPTKTENKQ